MTIAELGRHSGVGVETVRYYQRLGLLTVPALANHGHRRYGQESLAELAFVRRCKTLGFSLKEIGELVRLRRGSGMTCCKLHEHLSALSVRLAAKQRELETQREAVDALLASCAGGKSDQRVPGFDGAGDPIVSRGAIGSSRRALGRFEGYTSTTATETKLLRGVFRKGDAWFRSGDLMRQDAQGYFYFVDRIGDTYRWKGENVSTQEVAELLAPFPGVHMANVYGARVEGADGRAGMVALLLRAGASFDGERFYAFVSERLPRYASPVFVRIQGEADLTGTFKLRKVDLQKQGFDPHLIDEPLFARHDAARTYVPLTREVYSDIRAGKWLL